MAAHEMLSHDEAVELLPWLANDSLEEGERKAVREHALNCVACRQELEQLEALACSIAPEAEANEVPRPDMRNINARIDAALASESRATRLGRELRSWLGNPWRTAFAVQTLLVIVLATVWFRGNQPEPAYTTLSTPQDLPPGDYLRVVFDPSLDRDGLNEILGRHSLTIAEGPSERGVYTLLFGKGTAERERDTIIETFRSTDSVLFVQPVAGSESR